MADVTISELSPITPSTGLVLPVSNGSNTGRVTLAEVCGVMTSTQITNALGYVPVQPTSPAIAKAWVSFNGFNNTSNIQSLTNTNRYIYGQYNVSSVLRNAAGDYTVNFTTPFPNTNYCVITTSGSVNGRLASIYDTGSNAQSSLNPSSVRVMLCASTASNERADINSYHVVIYSN